MKKKPENESIMNASNLNIEEKIDSNTTSKNSFLKEIDYNDDISDSLRLEINNRYLRSRTNKTYKFPRVVQTSIMKVIKGEGKIKTMKYGRYDTNESKKNRSLSPYENSFRITKSKFIYKNELLNSSKTPIPVNVTSKFRTANKLPNLAKSVNESKKFPKFYDFSKRLIYK